MRTLWIGFFSFSILLASINLSGQEEESKPLLRVFPIYRLEECEWAIRMDICHRCLKIGEKYAQRIIFYQDKPYREHGCYSEKKGFYLLTGGNNEAMP